MKSVVNISFQGRFSMLTLLIVTILFNQLIDQTDGKFIRERFPSTKTSRSVQEEEGEDEVDKELEKLEAMNDLIEEVIGEDIGYYEDLPEGAEQEGSFMDRDGPKPIMHTFYQHIDKEHHHKGYTKNTGTGMSSDEAHIAMVKAWEESWSDAGFETRVLSIEDVMRHENYDQIREFLDNEAFGEYDELCFLRWYAMATVGGGWMSDYDVVPLKSLLPEEYFGAPDQLSEDDMEGNNGIPLPNEGKFTVYNIVVPSLMSGSTEEWERMASALMDLAHEHTKDFYSDMYGLVDMNKSGDGAYIKEDQVLSKLADFVSDNGDIDCEKVWKMPEEHLWAVHFSHWNIHDAVVNGILPGGTRPDDRPDVAKEFILKFEEECGGGFSDAE